VIFWAFGRAHLVDLLHRHVVGAAEPLELVRGHGDEVAQPFLDEAVVDGQRGLDGLPDAVFADLGNRVLVGEQVANRQGAVGHGRSRPFGLVMG
jgi:hypothetical protein